MNALRWSVAFWAAMALATAAADRPASAPASSSAPADVALLIRELGAPDYAKREAAQARLVALRAAAVEPLLAHLSDSDPEIANRVEAILSGAEGAELRAGIAVQMLDTGKPELVSRAAWMLFQDGQPAIAPFRLAAAQRGGKAAIAAPAILVQLESFVDYERRVRAMIPKMKDARIAARQPLNIEEQRRGLCFVATEEAADAIRVGRTPAASAPQTQRYEGERSFPPASRPAR